jgi:P pilus assembly chaperone PapD
MLNYRSFFIALFLLLLTTVVSARIQVTPNIVNHRASDSRLQTIKLINTSDKKAYVKLIAYKDINPGTDKEKSKKIKGRRGGIVVTPKKTIMQPNSQAFAQIIFRKPPLKNKDRNYRLEVKPVSGGSFEVSADKDSSDDDLTTGVRVLVGYNLPVIQRPAKLKPRLSVERKKDQTIITNTGNTQVVLTNFRHCPPGSSNEQCKPIDKNRRLYVGNSIKLNVPKTSKILYDQTLIDRSSTKTIPPGA